MKKYGKYEKLTEGVPVKQPKVKSALLQTYLTSLLCMVLCVTMFFGTTYAWFTSEVTNSGNEIYVGMLQAKLWKLNPDNSWNELNSQSEAKLYDKTTYWEPGYTSMETIKISNDGDLSFRYALTFTDGTVLNAANTDGVDTTLLEIAKYFTVYIHAGEFTDTDPKPATFAALKASAEAEDGTWRAVRMGSNPATLADILTREFPVLSGNIEEKSEEDTYIIALHMDETAGQGATDAESIAASQRLMGKSISLNVKLTAYQRSHESDTFNKDYDLQAQVTELGPQDITSTMGFSGSSYTMKLDQTYQFQPVETFEEWNDSTFRNYTADFVVWSESDIPADSVVLAGYYHEWCQHNEDRWVYLQSSDPIAANTEIPLVAYMGDGNIQVHYKDLCQYGNDGIGFLCGVKNMDASNVGKTIIVELRMYDPNNAEHYIVAGHYEYTLEQPSGTITEITTTP